jgi:hypothetical protein
MGSGRLTEAVGQEQIPAMRPNSTNQRLRKAGDDRKDAGIRSKALFLYGVEPWSIDVNFSMHLQ